MRELEASLYEAVSADEAFPVIDPGVEPFGERVLVQFKWVPKRTRSGIELPEEARDNERWNTSVAKVVKLGPLAYRKRDTMETWPEGIWAAPGDFVRAPRYGGDRWELPYTAAGFNEMILFAMFKDLELMGRITMDPMKMRAYF